MAQKNILRLVGSILAVGACTSVATAQSSDALLNKLVSKGILTAKEAEELQNESKEGSKKTVVTGLGLPDWVTGLKFYGDFRARFEEQTADSDEYHARTRYRYRVRAGLAISMLENFEVGVRLATGNPITNPGGTLVGGSPITANQDMNSLESRKFVWIDAAYGKWTPIKNDDWVVSAVVGKFDNPFQLSTMVWDADIVPEGASAQVAYNINKAHTLRFIGAGIVLDELNQTGAHPAHDPWIIGGQALWEAKWTEKVDTTLGVAVFNIDSKDSLRATGAGAQPYYNSGSTRDAAGFLEYNYNPIIVSGSAQYKFDHFACYPGKFPIKVSGEYMNNPGAPSENQAWRVGVGIGKAGKKHQWELNYRYQELEADAWFDALTDDDNGAFYTTGNTQLAGTGKANGWFGGTNVKGHQISAVYSLTDFLNFTFMFYHNELIIGKNSEANHFMADLNWKF